ncbi:bifunctional diaminohydroxyphosphoribosylaminopyrimidine deaminase/5-amino-6-(5-phosphoribosylamino)uracil reductase RibD [bacterium]|nr:bifunctional diaminohydroxyphosphoribosylaminopyrimidine deaminase/5-amino-6-(5-phosphoribosylamino)uracil reductase RibD [bacterium]
MKNLMRKCIRLARKGEGMTSPNPMVGCVVLDKNGKIIATGYHKKYGDKHAEADALSKIEKGAGDTLVVNLEPCSHFGKTPPCADLIIEKGIKRVVVGMRDVNPIVAGNGIKKLKSAGIEVFEGVLEDECRKLNEVFIKNMTEKRAFVALKTATTLDGKIAAYNGDSKWITSEKARQHVQKIRNMYDAILTSSTTVINDNPQMTCRINPKKDLVKIVVDRELKTDFSMEIYKQGRVLVAVDEELKLDKDFEAPTNVELIKCKCHNKKLDIEELLQKAYEQGIRSVLVEAGGKLNGEFVERRLVDKIYQFVAPKILCDNEGRSCYEGSRKEGIKYALEYGVESIKKIRPDLLITLTKKL